MDYEYNSKALTPPGGQPPPLTGLCLGVPVDGGVTGVQAKPACVWNPDTQRALWRLPETLGGGAGGRGGSLLARFSTARGPSTPKPLEARFLCEGATLSSADFELVGPGYRVSLVKRQVMSGEFRPPLHSGNGRIPFCSRVPNCLSVFAPLESFSCART